MLRQITPHSRLYNGKERVESGKKFISSPGTYVRMYIGQTGHNFATTYKEHVSSLRYEHTKMSNFAKNLLEKKYILPDSPFILKLKFLQKRIMSRQ